MADGRTKEEIIRVYQEMMASEKQLLTKVGELNGQESEYRLVAESIRPLEPSRKCFQLIGGVLVERTVGDVLPIVDYNRESLAQVIKDLGEKLQKQAAERAAYQQRYGIQAVPQSMAQQVLQQQQAASQRAQGGGAGGEDEAAAPVRPGGAGILA